MYLAGSKLLLPLLSSHCWCPNSIHRPSKFLNYSSTVFWSPNTKSLLKWLMLLTRRIFARARSVDSNRHKTGALPANIRFQAMEHNLSSQAQFSSEQATLEPDQGSPLVQELNHNPFSPCLVGQRRHALAFALLISTKRNPHGPWFRWDHRISN